MRILRVFCLPFFFFLICKLVPAQDLFDSLSTGRYADFLYRSANYNEAAEEYEEYLKSFYAEDEIKYRLVKSYRKAGHPGKALIRANDLWNDPGSVSLPLAKELFALRIITGETGTIPESIAGNTLLTDTDKMFLTSSFMLLNDEYHKAHYYLKNGSHYNDPSISSFITLAAEGVNLSYKKPWVSGTLSAFIPGTGKFYSGQWQDGLITLATVGSMAWQSYRGFNSNGIQSQSGWIFGTMGMFFYIGNITGSIKSAHRYNTVKRERIRIRVEEIFINNI
jgi:hypothetical protein